jgi:hypothetical protein
MELSKEEKIRRIRINVQNFANWQFIPPHLLPDLDNLDEMVGFLEKYLDEYLHMIKCFEDLENNSMGKTRKLYKKTGLTVSEEFKALTKSLGKFCGIYFLFCCGRLVYIGESTELGDRVIDSIAERTSSVCHIDSFAYYPAPTSSNRKVAERVLIAEHQPELNDAFRNDNSITLFRSQIDPYALKRYAIYENTYLSLKNAI